MSLVEFFDAARALKRDLTGDGLSQVDIDSFNAIINGWHGTTASSGATPQTEAPDQAVGGPNPTALGDSEAFFAAVRPMFGTLSQSQVAGIQALLQAFAVAAWPIAYAAYGLATGKRETNATMQPVREAYWLSEEWRKANLRYYPWYGRGYVQLTWRGDDKTPHYGYARADEELGLGGKLLADPDLALQSEIAATIMVRGMAQGWFSGKKLSDYLPSTGHADIHQFTNARQIINGLDAAVEIATNALKFQDALQAGGWR